LFSTQFRDKSDHVFIFVFMCASACMGASSSAHVFCVCLCASVCMCASLCASILLCVHICVRVSRFSHFQHMNTFGALRSKNNWRSLSSTMKRGCFKVRQF